MWYKDLPVEDLEAKYYALQKNYFFEDKEKQIEYMISTFLDASHNANTSSKRAGLKELLKEKTGKNYKLKELIFKISEVDLIDYIDKHIIKNSKQSLLNFFEKIDFTKIIEDFKTDAEDEEIDIDREFESIKQDILFCLLQDKKLLKKFISDINKSVNYNETFKEYMDWEEEYYSTYSRIG